MVAHPILSGACLTYLWKVPVQVRVQLKTEA